MDLEQIVDDKTMHGGQKSESTTKEESQVGEFVSSNYPGQH
jgi:hypothetical protein